MGIVYCLTSPSNKQYIGQTIRDFDLRLEEHKSRPDCIIIHSAIQKYGIKNFEKEILFTNRDDNEDELDEMEIKFIKEKNTLYPNGYNIRTGGKRGKHCDASREKMRLSKLGPKNHNFGKPRTPQTKMRISLAKKGEKHHFYGKKLSLDHKIKLSKAHKKDDLPMYMVRVKPRPSHYCHGGYAIVNHPEFKNKYFSSKKFSDDEKFEKAMEYLHTGISS
jgi:group I intron endonuclease